MRYVLIAILVFTLFIAGEADRVKAATQHIFFALCHRATCERSAIDEHATETIISTDAVMMISQSSACPETCTEIELRDRHKAHVVGFWLDVMCRLASGQFCVWNDRVLDPKDVDEIIRRSYGRPRYADPD